MSLELLAINMLWCLRKQIGIDISRANPSHAVFNDVFTVADAMYAFLASFRACLLFWQPTMAYTWYHSEQNHFHYGLKETAS
jgi:hypothetical protein